MRKNKLRKFKDVWLVSNCIILPIINVCAIFLIFTYQIEFNDKKIICAYTLGHKDGVNSSILSAREENFTKSMGRLWETDSLQAKIIMKNW